MRKTIIHGAENLKLELICEAKSGKESTMDQELDIFNIACEKATYNLRECVTMKNYSVNKPPYIQIRLFTAKENYALNEFNELSQISGDYLFVDNCKTKYCFVMVHMLGYWKIIGLIFFLTEVYI